MMESYRFLAGVYDELTGDVPYQKWADYLERQFKHAKCEVHTVLDLACGTGSLACVLAERGYEMIGVDKSSDMLTEAVEKARGVSGDPPMFLCQPMEKLDLYGTVDACVCCLDSVNYVIDPQKLQRAFERIHLFLAPGGVFIFDVNTPEKLMSLDGQVFLDEQEDVYCVWRAEYSKRRRVCSYSMDIFRRTGCVWERGEEFHEEYAYALEELAAYLRTAGFRSIKQYGNLKMRAPKAGEERVFFVARKDL